MALPGPQGPPDPWWWKTLKTAAKIAAGTVFVAGSAYWLSNTLAAKALPAPDAGQGLAVACKAAALGIELLWAISLRAAYGAGQAVRQLPLARLIPAAAARGAAHGTQRAARTLRKWAGPALPLLGALAVGGAGAGCVVWYAGKWAAVAVAALLAAPAAVGAVRAVSRLPGAEQIRAAAWRGAKDSIIALYNWVRPALPLLGVLAAAALHMAWGGALGQEEIAFGVHVAACALTLESPSRPIDTAWELVRQLFPAPQAPLQDGGDAPE